MNETPMGPRGRSAKLAFALLLPALAFVTSNLLAYSLGIEGLIPVADAFTPSHVALSALVQAVVLIGPMAAVVLSLRSILHVKLRHEQGSVAGSVVLRLSPAHIAVVLLGMVILGTMVGYLVVENLPCLTGATARC
jgi:hypothetical protein